MHVAVLDPMGWNRPHAVKTTSKVHAKRGKIRMETMWYQCFPVCEVVASVSMTWHEGTHRAVRALKRVR